MSDFATPADMSAADLAQLVSQKATCPFIGSALAQRRLAVRNNAANPLASIEDVRALGNTGGGDLGEVLAFFAEGNHASMRGADGVRLDRPAPPGLFSLEFPGSQGSHPGHSGILQSDPAVLASGRFSKADFERLTARAANGWIARSQVAAFIAENLFRDPKATVFGPSAVSEFAGGLSAFVGSLGSDLLAQLDHRDDATRATAQRDLAVKLARLTGRDNLVGSAGEFGLAFAFLANRPGAPAAPHDPALAEADLKAMFEDKSLPEGWDGWKKLRSSWLVNTTSLMIAAGHDYLALTR